MADLHLDILQSPAGLPSPRLSPAAPAVLSHRQPRLRISATSPLLTSQLALQDDHSSQFTSPHEAQSEFRSHGFQSPKHDTPPAPKPEGAHQQAVKPQATFFTKLCARVCLRLHSNATPDAQLTCLAVSSSVPRITTLFSGTQLVSTSSSSDQSSSLCMSFPVCTANRASRSSLGNSTCAASDSATYGTLARSTCCSSAA